MTSDAFANRFLEEEKKQILLREREAGEKGHSLPAEQFSALKAAFDSQTAQLRKRVENTKKRLENLFVFVENAFVEGWATEYQAVHE